MLCINGYPSFIYSVARLKLLITMCGVLRATWILLREFMDILLHYVEKFFGFYTRPWMRYKEIDVIVDILKHKKPRFCLEWGAGYSTVFFPRLCEPGSVWVSIEHNPKWVEHLKSKIDTGKVKIYTVTEDKPYFGDGDLESFGSYVKFPEKLGMRFDFILIDGRARKYCLYEAKKLLNAGGIVVLHDANRGEYQDALKEYPYSFLLTDSRSSSGGIWIGSLDTPISKIIDTQRHKQVWGFLHTFDR